LPHSTTTKTTTTSSSSSSSTAYETIMSHNNGPPDLLDTNSPGGIAPDDPNVDRTHNLQAVSDDRGSGDEYHGDASRPFGDVLGASPGAAAGVPPSDMGDDDYGGEPQQQHPPSLSSFYEGASLSEHPSSYDTTNTYNAADAAPPPRVYAAPTRVYAAPARKPMSSAMNLPFNSNSNDSRPFFGDALGPTPGELAGVPEPDMGDEDEPGYHHPPPSPYANTAPMMLTEHGEPAPEDEDGYLGGHYNEMDDDDDEMENRGAPVFVDHGDTAGVFHEDDEMEPLDKQKLMRQRNFYKKRRRRLLIKEEVLQWMKEDEDEKNRRPCWCLKFCCCCILLFILFLVLLTYRKRVEPVLPTNTPTYDDAANDDFTPYDPFKGIVTTPFDPYVRGDCNFKNNFYPNIINQCQCNPAATILRNDTLELYFQIRKVINATLYNGTYNYPYNSCDPKNQAMLWLASGDTRDAGDLYQRYILALVYIETNGTHWDAGNLWLSDQSECLWFGVQCNGNMKVNNLGLDMNNLMGSFPSEVYHLDGVQTLALSRNHLTGLIPTQLFNMTDLQILELYANKFRGSIPSEVGFSTSLKEFRVDTNLLFGELVSQIGNVTSLEALSIGFNEFWRHIPTEIGLLTNLRYLDLEANRFSGTVPTQMGQLTNLQYLIMQNNLLTGDLSSQFAQLTTLYELQLSRSGLGGTFPMSLTQLTSLYLLELAFDGFKGTIPTEIGYLTGMSFLALNNNDFTGPIPTELGNLVNMTRLVISDCLLTGTIPSQLGRMTRLTNFMCDKNMLTGTSPQQVCNLRDVNGGLMSVYVTDCKDGPTGVDCPRPQCCSFCRRAKAGVTTNPFG